MVKTAFAIMVSLLLAGGAARAESGDPAGTDRAEQGVVNLFGKRLCLTEAPADAVCDWRLAKPAPADDERDHFTFFGKRWCTVDADGPCDFRLPPANKPRAKVIRLFGMNWCFGDVSPDSSCEVKFPPGPHDGAHARL
jgi:hypothetical protein